MALTKHETHNANIYLNDAHKTGEVTKGYLKGVKKVEGGKYGPQWAFEMIDKDTGEEKTVVTGGSAKYVAMNLAMHLGQLPVEEKAKNSIVRDKELLGFYVEIVPTGSYKNKTGQTVNSFEFLVDKDLPLVGV
jgi:hypothetical protein